jgi:hypothetical protein
MVRKTPDRYRLTVIVANELAGADERFCDAFDGAPTRLVLKPVGGDLFGFVPSGGKRRVCLSELVDTSPASAGDSDCGGHAAGISKSLQEEILSLLGKPKFLHESYQVNCSR